MSLPPVAAARAFLLGTDDAFAVLVLDSNTLTVAAFTYVVTSLEVVFDDAGFGPVYGTDPAASVILLQTCLDHIQRLLVHGTLVAAA